MRLLILFLAFGSPAFAAERIFAVLQANAAGNSQASLLKVDKAALSRLLRAPQLNESVILPFPGGEADFRVEHASLQAQADLDCCTLILVSERGESTVQLSRSHELRDFFARLDGHEYRFRATGSGNFVVEGQRLP